ncbi:sodium-dependent transporter [Ructibacterium gallinarum]|uniref:Sodium-dependent transporter n=1 Tax=Ructibacterium gallinarum TaxID=2779355 RepID=A0A9D5R8T8_9FIRM|nr:sodium-dependent transporter [Ructibacterium gallinarum]MBE5039759.1 sodium-dependent transporter [Ructibacterium gallinarum]
MPQTAQTEPKHKNGSFTSSLGFVLACVGSAVGLGNIWMFPYRLGQYGGAAFLIPYLLFVFLFGWVGLSAEFAIGRRARTGTLGSYEYCFRTKNHRRIGAALGWIPLLGSLGIATGYAIIIGWVLRSLCGAVTGTLLTSEASAYFSQATGTLGSLPWHILTILIVAVILLTGVIKGIEKTSKILMPLFFLLFLILAFRVALLPGADEGYRFLFVPQWEALLRTDTWVMAMGQAFFSLSITGSGMIVYGAYLDRSVDIPKASVRTAAFDTAAALLSALAIMPAVFAFGIDPTSGPSLMFITIPNIFRQLPGGRFFAALFFLSVAFAGLTSLINMFEAVIESWQKKFKLSRTASILLCSGITLGIGLFLEAEPAVGSWMDFISIVVVPIGAVLGAFSIYFILGWKEIKKELETGRMKPVSNVFGILAKYVYVPLTILVLILGFLYHGIG